MGLFLVKTITNSTLNIPFNTYSLQDALNPNNLDSTQSSNGYITPYIFDTGCLVDGVQNCTAACQDPGLAFSNLTTLHNCMMYPVIADQYAKDNLPTDIVQLADSLGIEKEQWPLSSISRNITKTIGSCLDAYCSTLPGCNETVQRYNVSYYDDVHQNNESIYRYDTFLNQTGNFYFDLDPDAKYAHGYGYGGFDLCEYLPVSVNQDIGGIGVYISYWIQTGIGLLAFLMVIWWKWALYYLSLGVSALSPNPRREAGTQMTQSKARTARLAALTSALVDFHKAQCFFVLAINIAAQVDRAKGGLQPESLQQLYGTWVLIKSISIGGFLPVTFTLFTLHLVEHISWYLMSLTICTVAVSIATLVTIGNFNPSDADISYISQVSSTKGGPATCGEHTPGAWCYIPKIMYDDIESEPSNGAHFMLGFCVLVLCLLMAKQIGADRYFSDVYRRKSRNYFPKYKYIERWYSTWRKGFIAAWEVLRLVQQNILEHRNIQHLRRSSYHHSASWKPRWTQSEWFSKVTDVTSKGLRLRWLLIKEAIIKIFKTFRSTDWPKGSQTAFIVLFYATILGFYLYSFIIYCQDLAWFASHGISNSWSFGQIVAITVWAEPLCEYIHLEIRGIQRGFDHRLLAPYKVVMGDANREESVSDEKGADKIRAGEEEELATLPTINSSTVQLYPSSATSIAYEQVRDLDPPGTENLSESSNSANNRYNQVKSHEESMPLEVNQPEEEDITWQMSDFSALEREPLSYV